MQPHKSPPLLESIFDQLPWKDLDDIYIIACQHLLTDTHMIFTKLFEKGFPLENLSIIGKCYSASDKVVSEMLNDGIDVDESCLNFSSHKKFDCNFKIMIANFLKNSLIRVRKKNIKKLIILDDGGHLLAEVNKHIHELPPTVGIEQTTSGYEVMKEETLNYPIINIARSRPKLTIEPNMIVKGIWMRICNYYSQIKKTPQNILILGNGAIGKYLNVLLQDDYSTKVFDVDNKKTEMENLEQNLEKFDLIIGCSGKTSIPASLHHKISPGTVLASGSSSDREFDAVHLRNKIEMTANPHENLIIEGIHLLNCGFPVNFYGHRFSSIPLSEIQFTISLLSAALFQAFQTPSFVRDFIDLNHDLEKIVSEGYLALQQSHQLATNAL